MNIETIKNFINANEIAIVYFSNHGCGVCPVIKSKLDDILASKEKARILEVNIEDNQNLSGEFSVFSAPLGIVYVLEKETIRFGRNVDLLALEHDIERYIELLN